jgi:hypothetical protein
MVVLAASAGWAADDEKVAETKVKELGGRVQRDCGAPGQPVVDVNLAGTKVADDDLKHVPHMKELKHLNLSGTGVTDAGLKHVAGLTKLEFLVLPVRITDAGLVHLKKLTGLKDLSLLNSQVTDKGLASLKHLANVEVLLLNGSRVTDDGLRGLRQALPRAKISP